MRRVVALLVAAAAAAVGCATPAGAAAAPAATAGACAAEAGVTVVLDPRSLGGAPVARCVPDGGGRTALELFRAAGWPLTQVSRSPDFVCRVDGRPADDPCANVPPADAYWSLWQSDGSAPWSYASLGAPSLTVPDGWWVGFAWDDSDGNVAPSLTPTAGTADPSGAPEPTGTTSPEPTAATGAADQASEDGGLPGWVPPVLIVVLLGAAGGIALTRKAR